MLARTKDSATAGPACSAATVPVSTNIPAPTVQPTPKHVRLKTPSVLGRACEVSAAEPPRLARVSTGLRTNRLDMSSGRLRVGRPRTGYVGQHIRVTHRPFQNGVPPSARVGNVNLVEYFVLLQQQLSLPRGCGSLQSLLQRVLGPFPAIERNQSTTGCDAR